MESILTVIGFVAFQVFVAFGNNPANYPDNKESKLIAKTVVEAQEEKRLLFAEEKPVDMDMLMRGLPYYGGPFAEEDNQD